MNVIKRVAKKYGTTPDEVRKEMSLAIQEGFNNPDPEVQAMWRKLFPDGKQPSPEKFIQVLAGEVKRRGDC